MDQQYWDLFLDCKIAEYYYLFYAVSSHRCRIIVSALCLFSSAACITSWAAAGRLWFIWSALLVVAQLVAILQPLFPYDKRLVAARYIHSDLTKLCVDIECTWRSFSPATDDATISQLITQYQKRRDEIEEHFADADTFPQKMRLHKKAQKNASIYFRRFDNNENEQPAEPK